MSALLETTARQNMFRDIVNLQMQIDVSIKL